MFGNKKETENVKTVPVSTAINSLVFGTTVKGEVFTESDIRIDGKLLGKIECKGKLILGEKGVIEGDIICENAVIEGTFKGTIKVGDLLMVKENAIIDGDVTTDKLSVESGAKFNVTCSMGGQKIKPIKENTAS
jgi:cytoskeletal protein CcmA (bactofilin family)